MMTSMTARPHEEKPPLSPYHILCLLSLYRYHPVLCSSYDTEVSAHAWTARSRNVLFSVSRTDSEPAFSSFSRISVTSSRPSTPTNLTPLRLHPAGSPASSTTSGDPQLPVRDAGQHTATYDTPGSRTTNLESTQPHWPLPTTPPCSSTPPAAVCTHLDPSPAQRRSRPVPIGRRSVNVAPDVSGASRNRCLVVPQLAGTAGSTSPETWRACGRSVNMYRPLYCVGEVQIAGDVAKARDLGLAEVRRDLQRGELGERDYYGDKDYRSRSTTLKCPQSRPWMPGIKSGPSPRESCAIKGRISGSRARQGDPAHEGDDRGGGAVAWTPNIPGPAVTRPYALCGEDRGCRAAARTGRVSWPHPNNHRDLGACQQLPFVCLGRLYDADRGGGAVIAMLDVPGPHTNVLRAPEAHQRIPSTGKSLCALEWDDDQGDNAVAYTRHSPRPYANRSRTWRLRQAAPGTSGARQCTHGGGEKRTKTSSTAGEEWKGRMQRRVWGTVVSMSRGSASRSPRSRPAADPRGYAPASPEQTTSAVVFPTLDKARPMAADSSAQVCSALDECYACQDAMSARPPSEHIAAARSTLGGRIEALAALSQISLLSSVRGTRPCRAHTGEDEWFGRQASAYLVATPLFSGDQCIV
ncbi:hypothetical protein VTO73DRAFT_13837 [Trametes versicolor]